MENPFAHQSVAELTGRQTLKWQAYPPDVLPLWVAEMDTDLAEPVQQAVITAVRRGAVGYPSGRRYPEALASFAVDTWSWAPDPSTMRHTADVMTGLANLIRVVTPPDGVLVIPTPVYPPFLALPRITGREGRHVSVTAAGRLDLTALGRTFADVRAAGRQPVLLLCNPHNPTGVAHTRAELSELAELAAEFDARVLADEIHAPLVYPEAVFTPYLCVPGSERAYAVHSASKAFNLPGLKAALIIPGAGAVDELTDGLAPTLDHSASSVGVLAHAVALAEGRDWLAAHLAGLTENRALLGSLLGSLLAEQLPAIRWRPPEATYLAWLDCRALDLDGEPADAFLARGRVALNNGAEFGAEGIGHVRLNFATAPTILTEAVVRMRQATNELPAGRSRG